MTKVLLIEDEDLIVEVFNKQLSIIGGFEVQTAYNGREGLNFLTSCRFDVILLDLVMPEMDGIGFLREFFNNKGLYNPAPIIVFTNMGGDRVKEQVKQYNVAEFVIKANIDITQLCSVIERVRERNDFQKT